MNMLSFACLIQTISKREPKRKANIIREMMFNATRCNHTTSKHSPHACVIQNSAENTHMNATEGRPMLLTQISMLQKIDLYAAQYFVLGCSDFQIIGALLVLEETNEEKMRSQGFNTSNYISERDARS